MFALDRIRRTATVAAMMVVSALLAGACASERADDDGPRQLSKREYIATANQLQGDATAVFATLRGRLAATPEQAKVHVTAFDELIAGYEGLVPPTTWRDEHARLLEALRTMRHSMVMISRASPRNRELVVRQVERYRGSQQAFEDAVRDINASR